MRFADPRVQALAGSLATWDHAVSGITNKSLRAWMTGLLGEPYTITKASYDLARLSRNGLITRIPHSNHPRPRITLGGLQVGPDHLDLPVALGELDPRDAVGLGIPGHRLPEGGPVLATTAESRTSAV